MYCQALGLLAVRAAALGLGLFVWAFVFTRQLPGLAAVSGAFVFGSAALLFSVMPAGFITYLPVHVIRDGALHALVWLLLGAAASLALGIFVFQRGVRRYASGSRFGIWG